MTFILSLSFNASFLEVSLYTSATTLEIARDQTGVRSRSRPPPLRTISPGAGLSRGRPLLQDPPLTPGASSSPAAQPLSRG